MGFLRRRSTPLRNQQHKILIRRLLSIELLEDRLALSTFFVVGSGGTTDATHFQALQDALEEAHNGDAILINPGVAINSVGSTLGQPNGASALRLPSSPSDSTLITTSGAVSAGEEIQIGSGATAETNLVVGVSFSMSGGFSSPLLILKQPLTFAHLMGERIDTLGKIGVGKDVTISGLAGPSGITINSPLDVWGVTIGATLENLNFAASAPITLLPGSQATVISNSTLSLLTEVGGGNNNGRNVIEFDKAPMGLALTGNNSNTPTRDLILDVQGTSLSLEHDDGAALQGNVLTSLRVFDSQNVFITGNTITANGAIAAMLATTPGTLLPLSAVVINNTFSTGGTNTGLFLADSNGDGFNFKVKLQGNDFHSNVFGIEEGNDGGDSQGAAGIVDAGGGYFGSLGGNDFRGYTAAAAKANQQAAIGLIAFGGTLNSGGMITAHNNLWSVSDPNQVVMDFNNHNIGGLTGAGVVDVGTTQLTADEQFVQALYNRFLGRSGQISELDAWVSQIRIYGATGVANAVNNSLEGVPRTVDRLYQQFLGRGLDSGGQAFWVSRLQAGATLEQVMSGIIGSAEYYGRVTAGASSPNTAYVAALYQNLLDRTGSSNEVNFWVSQLPILGTSGVALAFLQSAEYRTIFVNGLYITILRRQAAPSEVAGWVNSAEPILAIEASFAGSMEFYVNG